MKSMGMFWSIMVIFAMLLSVSTVRAETELVGCDLSGACFRYMNLSSANLTFGIFRSTDFESANLSQSDFYSAVLSQSNFKKAKLQGAKTKGLIMTGVTCPDGSLSDDHNHSCEGHYQN